MPFWAEESFTAAAKPVAAVTLSVGILKNKSSAAEETEKYPRKDCPVCKGKGWYMSGDDIKEIECKYCEPNKEEPTEQSIEEEKEPELTEKDPPLVPVKPQEIESQRRRILIHRR